MSVPDLVADLRRLGVDARPVIVHASLSSIGWVDGGAPTLLEALLTATDGHAVLALTGWEEAPPYHQEDWPASERAAARASHPAFDPTVHRAEYAYGRFPETLRTWPGARHSPHPSSAFAAVGIEAAELVATQSLDEGYGPGSPLEWLVELDGAVLALGSPLEHLTLLHYAEYLADSPRRRWIEYEYPVLVDGRRAWRRIRELDSSRGAFPYEELGLDEDEFAVIGRAALAAGIGATGRVGDAVSYRFPAPALVDFAAGWLRRHFP
jgi:aminoglycoside 3-N-acetyltransferase